VDTDNVKTELAHKRQWMVEKAVLALNTPKSNEKSNNQGKNGGNACANTEISP